MPSKACPGVVSVLNSIRPPRRGGVTMSFWLRIRFPSRARMRMIRMFVKWVLPAPLPNDTQQDEVPRVHVRISVVGLVGIVGRVIWIHVVRHGTPVDQEIGWVIGLN